MQSLFKSLQSDNDIQKVVAHGNAEKKKIIEFNKSPAGVIILNHEIEKICNVIHFEAILRCNNIRHVSDVLEAYGYGPKTEDAKEVDNTKDGEEVDGNDKEKQNTILVDFKKTLYELLQELYEHIKEVVDGEQQQIAVNLIQKLLTENYIWYNNVSTVQTKMRDATQAITVLLNFKQARYEMGITIAAAQEVVLSLDKMSKRILDNDIFNNLSILVTLLTERAKCKEKDTEEVIITHENNDKKAVNFKYSCEELKTITSNLKKVIDFENVAKMKNNMLDVCTCTAGGDMSVKCSCGKEQCDQETASWTDKKMPKCKNEE